ncbi:MATE family efflux transporter [Maricurvus nonylphenolicus]|uniref:MATE family efflux transporter n=1 Tax=Maricurvus nonylphenolicus TaxID=1008307 RepID=UPI0036F31B28
MSLNLDHRRVWSLAWPMILSNISIPLLGLVDTAILGHLDSPVHLGAVALGASILSFVFWGFGFLRMGTTSLVAQAWGREDKLAVNTLFMQAALLALVLGLVLIVCKAPLISLTLELMDPPPEIAVGAAEYSHVRFLSAPAILFNLTLIGWFIGLQNTRAPLVMLVTTNLINIVLDAWFIIGLDMGSFGAALASAIAEACGSVIGIYLVLRSKLLKPALIDWPKVFLLSEYKQLLKLNSHLFLRTACLLFTFAFFNAQSAQLGENTLAANAILFQLLLFVSYGLDGFAHASEALIGQSVGAKQRRSFIQALLTTGAWSVGLTVVFTLLFLLAEPWLITLFTDIETVILELQQIYIWILLLPLVSVWAYWLDGVFIGSGQTQRMLIAMLIASAGVFFPLWWFTQHWGNHGLWLAFTVFNLARGVCLGLQITHIIPPVTAVNGVAHETK